MSKVNHLSWENFITSVLVPGQQRLHHVGGPPSVDIFGDGESNRIGIWIECDPTTNISRELLILAIVEIRHVFSDGRSILEITVRDRKLFHTFYQFAVAVADRILQENDDPILAVKSELANLAALLEIKPLLTMESQLGLLGELLVLEKLITRDGPMAISSWTGPRGEPHDFTLQERELEVKTTIQTRRIHTINGSEQLTPSPAHTLYLISILLGPPGSGTGFSLASKIQSIEGLLAAAPAEKAEFMVLLESCGYQILDHVHYCRCFILRKPSVVVLVDERLPAITSISLGAAFGERAARIERISYDLNIEGLELDHETSDFQSFLPA